MSAPLLRPSPLPRRHRARLAALETLWWTISVDAYQSVDEMVTGGWDATEAAEAVATWFVSAVAEAVAFGTELWQLERTA